MTPTPIRFAWCVLLAMATTGEARRRYPPVRVDYEPHRVEVRRFDRFDGRPSEVGGKPGDMNGVSVYRFDLGGYSYTYDCSRIDDDCRCGRTRLKLTSVTLHGRQTTTIFIPRDAGRDLQDHEQGHAALHQFAYDLARSKAAVMGDRMMAESFEGGCEADAKAQVDVYYQREFIDPYRKLLDGLNDEYEAVVDHGKNQSVRAGDAARQIIARHTPRRTIDVWH